MPPNVSPTDKNGEEWHTAMLKMFFLDKKETEQGPDPNVLMEVVSARGLTFTTGVDPSCIVRVGEKQVHRTQTIWNDPDPIWTVLTGSLCLLSIPEGGEDDKDNEKDESVCVEVCHGNQCIGIVTVSFKDVLQKAGEREEYPIRLKPGTKKEDEETDDLGKLALRFRKACEEDVKFFEKAKEKVKESRATSATDIHFKKVRGASSSLFSSRKNKDGVKEYKTQPKPDPERVEETTWLSKEQLKKEALKPSTHWYEAGKGDMGKVHVEIIGCDDLVNLDVGVNDMTDAFCFIAMEDNVARTSVVNDSLHPRFMPWSSRAFCFNISHSSSLMFLGVFDYDALDNHDPIGRVVINTAKFQSNTSYLLHYPLHFDMHNRDRRGKITIRLRVEWKCESLALRKAFTVPPRFLINVQDEKSLELLRFVCRGAVNMEAASMDSVKILADELMEYGLVLCYLIDVMIGIFLWRGRVKFSIFSKEFKVWFPVHSIFIFVAAVLAIEFPLVIPAIFFYSIAWGLTAIGYHSSTHPNPWQRCRSMSDLSMVRLMGRSIHGPVRIEPKVGADEGEALAKLDKVKAERVAAFFSGFVSVGLKVRKIYKKTNVTNIAISTEDNASWSMLGSSLTYVHLGLYMLVTYLNVFRNFMNWRSFGAYFMSMQFLTLGTIFLVFPMHYVILWLARILVWIFLGPLMKLVDLLYIRPRYRNRDELEANPECHETNLESILTSDSIKVMIDNGRLASEEALKLKHMREYKFGKFAQQIPTVDTQRKPCVPLPESTAEPYLGFEGDPSMGFVDTDKKVWHSVPGQNLAGSMIPRRVEDETKKF